MVFEFFIGFIFVFCAVVILISLYGAFSGKIPKETYNPDEYVSPEKAYLITDFRRLKQLSELERADRISGVDKKN